MSAKHTPGPWEATPDKFDMARKETDLRAAKIYGANGHLVASAMERGSNGKDAEANAAMLSAAARHYDRLYGSECECARCCDPVDTDEAEVWDSDEYYCDWCLDNPALKEKERARLVLPRWAGDFISEVIFEDEGERSVFFAPVTGMVTA